ncbi:unnamed protein product [Periconia digitata]|uniref:Zn(2)-C6 fungal-type domain-containing protein n=1 Tax=Periconia digitata TaxID=1303443 RepID=A0A9W4XM12_9PLEO|nr:unnamed protein product [Periconia digitata]
MSYVDHSNLRKSFPDDRPSRSLMRDTEMEDQAGTANNIAHWLDQLHLGDPEDGEHAEGVHTVSLRDALPSFVTLPIQPVTPPRDSALINRFVEVSPTDTTFSENKNAIFDSPQSIREIYSVGSARHNKYAETDASSVDETDNSSFKDGHDEINDVDSTSHQPTSTVISARKNIQQPNDRLETTRTVPSTLNRVCVLSCLQCAMKDLPCSRTTPSCQRCNRNDTAESCLLQRRRTADEMLSRDRNFCRTPVLLFQDGETENGWAKKVALQTQLLDVWKAKEDRRNWVYPSLMDSKADHKWELKGHPGEGKGRLSFVEMEVLR